jgi:hypothetical protein
MLDNEMEISVSYRDLLPGPVVTRGHDDDDGWAQDAIAVVDYDGVARRYYKPIDLGHPRVLIQNGLSPSESDPRFHQQMVYAVASETIERFEAALGRRIHWRRAEKKGKGWQPDDILTLNLYPHAMQAANAFYCPDAHGILFGYFVADSKNPGLNLPGQPVFTCLSHDIIVHEVTHAIVDGLRGYFLEQTNVDVPAFHEAFADLAALFQHFSHEEVLLDALQRTGGRLYQARLLQDTAAMGDSESSQIVGGLSSDNPLIDLATQFGEATGLPGGLRKALDSPMSPDAAKQITEPHKRGTMLVAAVFDAFFSIYVKRTQDLFRIYRAGGGSSQPVDLPESLARALCTEAIRTAKEFFELCVRALDYCPPVDITFGDFLRAVITAHFDYDPSDPEGIRYAWMQSFRMRGLLPTDASYFSEQGLCWKRHEPNSFRRVEELRFGSPAWLSDEETEGTAAKLRGYVESIGTLLGLEPGVRFDIPSFHPVYRTNRDGSVRTDMIVEVVQTKDAPFDAPYAHLRPFPFRGGVTLIISSHGTGGGRTGDAFVRYAIGKPLGGGDGEQRLERQKAHLQRLGLADGDDPNRLRMNFALVHGGF